jgi:ABC-2 type transport system permease protein
MQTFVAIIIKEFILLKRDRAGLIFLFIMPAILVLVITLVQQNVLTIIGETKTSILLLDLDAGDIGKKISSSLEKSGKIEIIQHDSVGVSNEEAAVQLVSDGKYKACIIVPPDLSSSTRQRARQIILDGFTKSGTSEKILLPELKIYFDPTVLSAFRSGILSAVQMTTLGIETEAKIQALLKELPNKIETQMRALLDPSLFEQMPKPDLQYSWNAEEIINISKQAASRRGMAHFPSPVQQNVPAYALFGIFFIVLPLAGSLLKERQDGLMGRLLTMPVSPTNLIAGKITAYILVCCCQFAFIVFIGKFILPALGTDALVIGPKYPTLIIICLSAILAANGYGILLGALCRTFKQVSTMGPISVVIAAALGGIMVPVHAMPEIMQKISLISPLGWGLEAFLEILVRGGNFQAIIPEITLLLLFFFLTSSIGITMLLSRVRNGK